MKSLSGGEMSNMFEEPKRGQYYWRQMNDREIIGDMIRESMGSLFGGMRQPDRVGSYKDN